MNEPASDWSEAEAELMRATYRSLLEHGYADLSVSRIADELGKSKASIYYHYDSKEALLTDFLGFAVDRFEAAVAAETGDDPSATLDDVLDRLLPRTLEEEHRQVQTVILELRTRALTKPAFREAATEMDDRLAATVREAVETGIEDGVFDDTDAEAVAEHVLATANGAMYARATTDREAAAATVRDSLEAYLDETLGRR